MHEWLWDGTPYYYVDLIVRGDGRPAVSMEEHWNLQVLSCSDSDCADWRRHYLSIGGEHVLVETADGRMVLPSLNGPRHHSGYPPTGLDLFRCTSYLDCRIHRVVTIDENAWFGRGPSAVVGADGNLVIAYLTEDHGLRVARCLNPRCGAVSIVDVDPLGIAEFGETAPVPAPPGGWYVGSRPDTAMVLGSDGNPVIAYVSAAPEEGLKLIRCLDEGCSSTTEPMLIPGRYREIQMQRGPDRGKQDTVVLVYQETEPTEGVPVRLTVAAFRI
jgi:hypothetical protein